jgi:multidrug efflux system outer membrane protein
VLTTIVSDVAGSYFILRELDFELVIAKRTLVSRQESLRIITLRQQRGVSNLLELRQAEELVYNATETIPALERSIQQQEDFLSVLIGHNPGPIARGLELTEQQTPPAVPPGIPSDLIARRPDIRSAENSLVPRGAHRRGAQIFPRISISAFLDSKVLNSRIYLSPHSVWDSFPVAQPIFTGGLLKSNVKFTQAQEIFSW